MNHYYRSKRLLQWTYYCLGGIYTSRNFSKLVKSICFFINAGTIFLVSVIGGCGYVVTVKAITVLDLISVTFMPAVVIFVLGVIPFITHSFHREFEELFRYIENCATIPPQEASSKISGFVSIKRVDSIKRSWRWSNIAHAICLFYVVIAAFDILFVCEQENSFRNLQHHIFPMPYLDRIPSLYVFWVVYTAESIFFLFLCVTGIPEITFVTLITSEFNNIVMDFCERMQSLTEDVTTAGDKQQSLLSRTFEKDLKSCIDEHRHLVR